MDRARTTAERSPSRSLRRAGDIGGLGALIVFLAFRHSDGGFGRGALTSSFYDVQAQRLLDLRWDMPKWLLGVEGFRTGSKWYMYFGPTPAFVRMPLMAVRPGLTGHLSTVMMAVALTIAMLATSRLMTRIRGLVRDDAAVTTGELVANGIFVFGCGAASTLLFLGNQPWVYHEALLWGVGLTLAAYANTLAFVVDRRPRSIVFAAALGVAAVLARGPVALGVVAAFGLLACASLNGRTRRWFGLEGLDRPVRSAIGLAAAAVAPIVGFAYVNYVKFASLFALPNDRQQISLVNPNRIAVLASNGGGLFAPKYVLTNVVQYLRPDALRFQRLFPFVGLPPLAHNFGGHLYDTIEPTVSIPASMPLLTALAAIGIVVAIRPGTRYSRAAAPLRAILIAAVIGPAVTLTLAYIAQRYIADVIPFLVIAAALGFWVAFEWSSARIGARRGLTAGLVALTLFGLVVNLGLGINYRYLHPFIDESPRLTSFVNYQYRMDRRWRSGTPPDVVRVAALPRRAGPRSTVAVVGDCDGVYWSTGAHWFALGRTTATRQYDFSVRFPAAERSTWLPVLVAGPGGRSQTLAARIRPGNRLTFGLRTEGGARWRHFNERSGWVTGATAKYEPGREYLLRAILDPNNGTVRMTIDVPDRTLNPVSRAFFVPGHLELTQDQVNRYVRPYDEISVGSNTFGAWTEPMFTGTLRQLAPRRSPSICKVLEG
jgi:hypothetical protein